jgi:hypothetical protein
MELPHRFLADIQVRGIDGDLSRVWVDRRDYEALVSISIVVRRMLDDPESAKLLRRAKKLIDKRSVVALDELEGTEVGLEGSETSVAS